MQSYTLYIAVFFAFIGLGACSPECHWNGRYVSNKCHCFQGYTGVNCATDCHCQGHGTCKSDGTCECETGWKWSASQHKCVWDCQHCDSGTSCIGPGECGCAHPCKWGACRNGQCVCYAGYKGEDCSIYDKNLMMNKDVEIGINLGGITYYSPEVKWVDLAQQSQEWITQRASTHDWSTGELDKIHWRKDGYPARLDGDLQVGKLMLRGFGEHEESGRYTVLYDGQGHIDFSLVGHTVHYDGQGRMIVEFPSIKNGGIFMKITATNPSDPIHNVRVLLPGYENTYLRFPFHPLHLEFLKRFSEIRFMDFLHTNGHGPEPTTWATRKTTDFHSQAGEEGGAIEHLVQLVNTVGVNAWINVPHAADDDYVKQLATYVHQHIRPDLHVYVEYSNEVWNGIFRQTKYTREQGAHLFPSDEPFKQGMRYHNKRATEIANIWKSVWGSQKNRVTTVYAWQTGYQGYYDQALIDLGSRKSSFDALAITGYFGCDKATTKHADQFVHMTPQQIQHLCDTDLPNVKASFAHYVDVAKAHGLKLVMYEGGPSIMEGSAISGNHGSSTAGVTDKAISFHRDPHIQKPVEDVLDTWYNTVSKATFNQPPGGLFNYFASVSTPSKYGSWGMAEWTGQNLAAVPKWRAVQTFISRHWPNNPLGPKCSFVKDRVTSTVYGCFLSGGHYVCAKSANGGHSWTNLPSLHQGSKDHVTVDGYNGKEKKVYARVTASLDVNTYHVFSEHTNNWSTLGNFQYFTEEMSPDVIPRFPVGASHGLDAHHQC
ncbi:hypothetical protein V1264_022849 [Littorina saxatilis]